jgi:hypothetical protein
MAVVVTTLFATMTRVPFIKPPDMQRMITAMPRSIMTAVVDDGVLDAKPINDQQTLSVGMVLPFQFAYRQVTGYLRIINQGIANWQDGAEVQITNGMRGQPLGVTQHQLLHKTDILQFSPIAAAGVWEYTRIPSTIIQSIAAGVSPVMDIRTVNNAAAASVAATVQLVFTFYEYDIEQVQMFPSLVPHALTYDLSS